MWLLALPVAMSQTTLPRESLNKYSVHMMAILEYYFQYISFKNNYFAFSLYECKVFEKLLKSYVRLKTLTAEVLLQTVG